VEDSRTQRLIYALWLREQFELSEAASGAEAVARAAEARPDAVILDLHLPDTDAVALLPRLPAGVPVLVVSTDTFEEECKRAVAAGARSYLLKPVEQEKLVAELVRVMG
jgi:DNA-binding response OmpR family regulator